MAETQRVYGLHAVRALLRQEGVQVVHAWAQDSRHDPKLETLIGELQARGSRVDRTPRRELDRLAPGVRHQGILVEFQGGIAATDQDLDSFLATLTAPALLLVLDGVTDPHNLGACLRSADAAGVQAVILPKDRSVGLTPVVRKVACGAAESLPVFSVTNLARTLRTLQDAGIWIYGAAGEAEQTLYDVDLKGSVALVLGAEGGGLRRLTREHCDGLVKIPMAGTVESLNVSVATAVLLFEVVRQRWVGQGRS
ncbi:MAG: 23S rRNA (guanosine(2251)-2'-O)-methyltransferase RlmB [Gammaproteobacteria bacterium]|nr:23S rRNA (guanosine(2251)-2'-O)-methyltransferase RlmB [Gammaproteobacteria bacterium]